MIMTNTTVGRAVSTIALLALFPGCGAISAGTATNEPICPNTQVDCRPALAGFRNPLHAVPRARQQFEPSDAFKPKTFVGLALSGGGSRAANFSLAAMQQLDEIGLLSNVMAISSTSGGGLAGAYYSIHGSNIDWPTAKELFRTNFINKWIARNLYPHNLLGVFFTHRDRADLMAEVLDDTLFSKATFNDLGKEAGPGRPIWIANATNVTNKGLRFTFTEEDFTGFTRSRLDNY